MKIGYARVSTHEQNLNLQLDALEKENCQRIYRDEISGAKSDRPQLSEMMKQLRQGDVVVVWRLDRLGRSVKHLIELVEEMKKLDVGLKSLNEGIDTSTSAGTLIFHIFSALAEFERNLIRERTIAGLAAARARGVTGGRLKALPKQQRELVKQLYHEKDEQGNRVHKIKFICETMNISRATLYRYVGEES